jgi:hypothetical protein
MIFRNPAGAPELACDACGCRWFDRMTDTCYECGTPVPPEEAAKFASAVAQWSILDAARRLDARSP